MLNRPLNARETRAACGWILPRSNIKGEANGRGLDWYIALRVPDCCSELMPIFAQTMQNATDPLNL